VTAGWEVGALALGASAAGRDTGWESLLPIAQATSTIKPITARIPIMTGPKPFIVGTPPAAPGLNRAA
jgi:hypothetical protein